MGVIGCGWAGGQHARAMRALADRVELCAIADVDAARAADRAAAWQVPLWSDDWRSLLERTPLDAVSVCLPHRLHAPVAIAAAQAGRHVLVEKPLAPTLAEADAMIAAADRARVRLMVAENARFDATFLRVAALVHAGALGEVFLVRISREHEMHAYLRERPWFLEDPSAGIIYSGGIHDFELLRMLAGEPEHVYGLAGRKVLPEMVGDDSGVALVGLAGGCIALIVESFSLKTPEPGVHGTVHGARGSLWFHRERIRLFAPGSATGESPTEEILVPARDTFRAELEHFFDCLEADREPLTSAREERKPLLAVLATYESIGRGERVYLAEYERREDAGRS